MKYNYDFLSYLPANLAHLAAIFCPFLGCPQKAIMGIKFLDIFAIEGNQNVLKYWKYFYGIPPLKNIPCLVGTYVTGKSVDAIVETLSETLVKLDISSKFSFRRKLELASMPRLQVLGSKE